MGADAPLNHPLDLVDARDSEVCGFAVLVSAFRVHDGHRWKRLIVRRVRNEVAQCSTSCRADPGCELRTAGDCAPTPSRMESATALTAH